MKHLTAIMCIVSITLCTIKGFSQNRLIGKPSLFTACPATISCTEAQLSSLFSTTKSQHINMSLADNFTISGPVTSKQIKYSNLETIIIKLTGFKNTLFSLSRQTDKNNNKVFVGHILNSSFSDGFELKRTAAGNYQLTKIDVEKILVNCSQ